MTLLTRIFILAAGIVTSLAHAQDLVTWANQKIFKHEGYQLQTSPLQDFNAETLTSTEDGTTYISDYIIVELNDNVSAATQQEIADSINGTIVGEYPKFRWLQIQIKNPSLDALANYGHLLLKRKDVNSISFDYLIQE